MAKPKSMSYTQEEKTHIENKKQEAIDRGILDINGVRKKLKKVGSDDRATFYGTFERCGRNTNGKLTILMKDIRNDKGTIMSDHIWFNLTQGFKNLGFIEPGELIQFDARVKTYEKGYKGQDDRIIKQKGNTITIDYKLSHPTKIKRFLGKEGQRITTIEKWSDIKKMNMLADRLDTLTKKYDRYYRWQEYQNI